jgi:hypothetical protein
MPACCRRVCVLAQAAHARRMLAVPNQPIWPLISFLGRGAQGVACRLPLMYRRMALFHMWRVWRVDIRFRW